MLIFFIVNIFFTRFMFFSDNLIVFTAKIEIVYG